MRLLRLAAAALAFCACAGPRAEYLASDYQARAPLKVALLPFENLSVDLTGPEQLRRMVQEKLTERGYSPLPLDSIDAKLAELGIHEGGQLAGLEPARIAAALGADGLFYGTVEEFAMQNIGFVTRRTVRLRLRLLAAVRGERLWEDIGHGVSGTITLDTKRAERVFVEGVIRREVENLTRAPLMPESRAAVQELVSRLPGRLSDSPSEGRHSGAPPR